MNKMQWAFPRKIGKIGSCATGHADSIGAAHVEPYGFYWEEFHIDSETVVNDGFTRDLAMVPTGKSRVKGFAFRSVALYSNGGILK